MKKHLNLAMAIRYKIEGLLLKAWPIVSRLIPTFYYPYRLPGGRVYLDISESAMMLERAMRRRSRTEIRLINQYVTRGGTFVDIGSNKGEIAVFAASVVGEEGLVLAIEPHPGNCRWIEKTVVLNGYDQIKPLQLAVSDKNGVSKLHIGAKSGWHSLLHVKAAQPKGTLPIETRRLDDLIDEQQCKSSLQGIKIGLYRKICG